MSFIIRNLSAGVVDISDLGISLQISEDYDLSQQPPNDIALSTDLPAHITAGNISVLDPLDGTTPMGISDSLAAVAVSNDPNYRIHGGTINQLDDVTITSSASGNILRFNGSDWVNTPESNIGVDRIQAIYVGKHGNDSNDGLTPNKAKLTFSAAITVATGMSPGTSNRIGIICDDGGTYTESFTIPSWVHISAESATVVGKVTLSDDSEAHLREVNNSTDVAVEKPSGTSTARINIDKIIATGSTDAVRNGGSTSVLIANVRQVYVEDGTGFLDNSSGPGHIHLDVEDIYITGTGVAIDRGSNTGAVQGRVSHILEQGAGVGEGTAVQITDGEVHINVGTIDTETAWSVSGSGTLKMFVNYLSPNSARVQLSGNAVVDVVRTNILRWSTKTSNFTAERTDFVSIDTVSTPVTMYLPSPPSDGDNISFQDSRNNFNTNNFTVDAGVGFLIDDGGAGTQTVVLDIDGTSGIFIYNSSISRWTFSRIQEEVAFSPENLIYVTKNGDDTLGDGSFSNPFLTIKKGVQEALTRVASTPIPTTVKVLDGVYSEVNPINITGTNSNYVSVQGDQEFSIIVQPTVDTQPMFNLTSPIVSGGPALERFSIDASSLPTFKTNDQAAIVLTGQGRFVSDKINILNCGIGLDSGNGTSIDQEVVFDFATISGCNTGIDAKGDGVQAIQVTFLRGNTVNLRASENVRVEMGNWSSQGALVGDPVVGTGFEINDNARLIATSGTVSNHVLGLSANDNANITFATTTFENNTTEFDQVDATAVINIQGLLSKTKQLIADGSNISLNYIDTDSGDFIVGNAVSTGTPGREFRVRDFGGRVFIGDNATDANGASNTVGGVRSINLIDSNGNMRIWRFTDADGEDPALEWIKGINPAISDDEGDAPITAITAATDTITIDVSGTDYNDPFDTTPGIDRTTLAGRAFPPGAQFRVNGTASNNGDYVVSSATYNSGPETIDIVVTADITVTEGTGGEVVFGGGAGRPDGVSTYSGDPGAAVAAGVGDVHWDMFLQEDDYFVIRHRTGGGGAVENEKVRVYADHSEWLGATTYGDTDNSTMLYLQTVADAVNYLEIDNAITGSGPQLQAIGTDTNVDIEMIPKGTGTVTVPSGYEANITSDQDLINRGYLSNTVLTQLFHHNGALTQTFTAATTILFNTAVRVDSDYSYSAGEVTINRTGWYEVTYSVTADDGSGARTTGTHVLEVNTVAVPGSVSNTYHRNGANGKDTATVSVLVNLTSGDVLRVRSSATSNITTVGNGCRLRIESKL